MQSVLRIAHSLTGVSVLPPRPVRASFRHVLGLQLCDLAWDDALAHIHSLVEARGRQTVLSFLNAHNANVMLHDPNYRAALSRHLVFPDGIGVNIASRLLTGRNLPANLNGTDFVPALLTYLSDPLRIGLVGAQPEVLQRAAATFSAHAPWHTILPISDGFFDKDDCPELLDRIEVAKLDILIVAMGTPLQEVWVDRKIRPEHATLVITAGALFDFVSGRVSRAPQSWRRLGLEWLHRLKLEPRRLWKRYVLGIPLFFVHLMAFLLFDDHGA